MSSANSQIPPFLSIYDLKFGKRKSRPKGTPRGVRPDWEREPVDVAVLATVIREFDIKCIDGFGRWVTADVKQKETLLLALEHYVDFVNWEQDAYKVQEYEAHLSEPEHCPEWNGFGWEVDQLPDMSGIYRDWLKKETTAASPKKPPKASSKVYAIVAGYLKQYMTSKDFADFSGGYAAGNKVANKALKQLLAEVGEDVSDKPIAVILNNARKFALMHLSEGNKE